MGPQEMEKIAELIHRVLSNIRTFQVRAITGVRLARGKIDRDVMNGIREEVAQLMDRFAGVKSGGTEGGDGILEIRGERARSFLQQVCTGNVMALETGKSMHTLLLDKEGVVLDDVVIHRAADENGFERYWLSTLPASRGKVKRWLSDLSDGFVAFDAKDVAGKIDGPVEIRDVPAGKTPSIAAKPQGRAGAQASAIFKEHPEFFQLSKPYFIGQAVLPDAKGAKAPFHYEEYKGEPRRTLLYKEHLKRTSPKFMIPFAGWSMPVWYTRASEEHAAVRNAAGLFDVSHMGRIDIKGAYAGRFVDLIASNYVPLLKDGGAHYSYIFDPEGSVMDDILVYRFAREHYFLIVNAANAEKILAWINAVADRKTALDPHCPWKEVEGRVEITDVRSEKAGDRQNVNVALQGPNAMDILLKVAADEHEKTALRDLGSFHFVTMTLGGMKAVVARTGYTGEEIGYEILVGAGDAVNFWTLLLEAGEPLGIKPCGLAARDSLRLEAGLPLYGHELAGELGLTPTEAGYGGFVKRHKTFFVGRSAYLKKESEIRREVARFQLNSRQARMVHPGDAVVEKEGKRIGVVTSCTLIDKVQSGLACLDLGYKKNGGALAVLVASKGGKEGEREELVILPRFPMRKKRNARPAKPSNGSK
ncbi:MAG: glycine cleavage system protein T [Planctomycetes bacterium RBG_16_59_8]|nr:MAG: glycine cleavage system protein T [Planctomycetes bacterium RBG_16_59_8]